VLDGPGKTGNLPDPTLHADETKGGKALYSLKRFTGPLMSAAGPKFDDGQQGHLGDCYESAAQCALAAMNPKELGAAMKDNGDGTYSFTFQEKKGGKFTPKVITVDGDLFARPTGEPIYATGNNASDASKMILWPALLEKAFALLKGGSYNDIGNGGQSYQLFEAILGRPAFDADVTPKNADATFDVVQKKLAAGLPVCLGTYDEGGTRFNGSGVYGDHTYTALKAETINGEKILTLRNPWGESEPSGNGADDGVFKMKMSDVVKYYNCVWSVT
jgi:hypothetical protein